LFRLSLSISLGVNKATQIRQPGDLIVDGSASKDPELLDDEPHEPMTIQTRLAAEREKLGRTRGAEVVRCDCVTWMVKLCEIPMHKMEDEEPSLKHLEALKLPDFVTCSCHSLRMAERDVREGRRARSPSPQQPAMSATPAFTKRLAAGLEALPWHIILI